MIISKIVILIISKTINLKIISSTEGIFVASKIQVLNQKVPLLIKHSQRDLIQLEHTSGDVNNWKSKDLEHLEVEKEREGFLDITYFIEEKIVKEKLDSCIHP